MEINSNFRYFSGTVKGPTYRKSVKFVTHLSGESLVKFSKEEPKEEQEFHLSRVYHSIEFIACGIRHNMLVETSLYAKPKNLKNALALNNF